VDPADQSEVYLCLEANTMAPALLSVLDRAEAKAAFFCAQEFLETEQDLLRRMVATGHTVGLLVDASHEELTVTEQLTAGNETLYRATCTKTRLCYVGNGDQERVAEAESAGFRCLIPEVDRGTQGLQRPADAESLLQRITARRENTTVWLGGLTSSGGLQAFLTQSEAAVRCLALTETV
jgi:peptidoglycan/xylan/chitin deacetylase (PgdA/CDA1 family)